MGTTQSQTAHESPILLRAPTGHFELPAGTGIVIGADGVPDRVLNEFIRRASIAASDERLSCNTLKAKTHFAFELARKAASQGASTIPLTRAEMVRMFRALQRGVHKRRLVASTVSARIGWYYEVLSIAAELGELPRHLLQFLFPDDGAGPLSEAIKRNLSRQFASKGQAPATSTPDEADAIRLAQSAPSVRERLVIELYRIAGLRLSEPGAITADVVAAAAAMQRSGENALLDVMGKGRKQRRVPVPWGLIELLNAYRLGERQRLVERFWSERPPPAALILSRRDGKPLTGSGFDKIVRAVRHKAGVEHITAHALRRRMGLNWAEDNNPRSFEDFMELQAILGHAYLSTTLKHYLVPVRHDRSPHKIPRRSALRPSTDHASSAHRHADPIHCDGMSTQTRQDRDAAAVASDTKAMSCAHNETPPAGRGTPKAMHEFDR